MLQTWHVDIRGPGLAHRIRVSDTAVTYLAGNDISRTSVKAMTEAAELQRYVQINGVVVLCKRPSQMYSSVSQDIWPIYAVICPIMPSDSVMKAGQLKRVASRPFSRRLRFRRDPNTSLLS